MGIGMARNLLRAGHAVTLYNRNTGKAEALRGEGARVAATPAEACAGCEAAITMLADDAALEAVVFGPQGMLDALEPESVHISCSTVSTAIARRLADAHGARRQAYVSAPVFGRPEAAEAGKLLVVAAGPAEQVARCRPLFDAIGRQTFEAGSEAWQANAVKLNGNFMIGSMLEAFSEAFATLRKASVDPHFFLEIMNTLFGSPVYAAYGKAIAEERFEPAGFALRLALKDVRLLLQTAEECESPMPLGSLLRDRLLTGVAQGQGELDWSSIARVSARSAGL
jgi:3-hydroxyisobutyrate dehydrogenase-like beta-hydroxyacid dehydrogenase